MVTLGATSILTEFGLPPSSFGPPPGPPKVGDPLPIGSKIKVAVGTSAWAHLKGLVEQNNTLQSHNALTPMVFALLNTNYRPKRRFRVLLTYRDGDHPALNHCRLKTFSVNNGEGCL